MTQIVMKVDTRELERSLGQFKGEVPFAVARGINDVMLDIQSKEVQSIHDRFTVRRPAFVKRSVKITQFARKETMTGIIGIADIAGKGTSDILSKFEAGGRKTPSGGGSIAVPTAQIRPDKSRLVTKSRRPRNLKNSFRVERGATDFIFQRVGRGRKASVRLAYVLKPSVHIDRRLGFESTAVQTFQSTFQSHVTRRVEEGITKARLR